MHSIKRSTWRVQQPFPPVAKVCSLTFMTVVAPLAMALITSIFLTSLQTHRLRFRFCLRTSGSLSKGLGTILGVNFNATQLFG